MIVTGFEADSRTSVDDRARFYVMMEAFAITRSSRPTAGSVAVLLSGTMRGFREQCIPSLRENIVQPNAQHGVAIFLATYVESDCGKKIRAMRREGALTGVSLHDGVTVLPIVSLRASDINTTYLQYADPTLTL